MSGWTRREAVQENLVVLGDGPGQKKTCAGLLIAIVRNRQYEKDDYELVRRDGETMVVGGNSTLGRQISAGDVGKFIKCEFKGWGRAANGKFKEIEVNVYEGDPTPEMKAWPRYAEVQASLRTAPAPKGRSALPTPASDDADRDFADFPAALEDEDDNLPF